jgi:hypothetical protein
VHAPDSIPNSRAHYGILHTAYGHDLGRFVRRHQLMPLECPSRCVRSGKSDGMMPSGRVVRAVERLFRIAYPNEFGVLKNRTHIGIIEWP